MLIKCIKHDLLATYREFSGLYTALILLAIVGPFIINTNNEFIIAILFFGIFGLSRLLWRGFYKNPVSK